MTVPIIPTLHNGVGIITKQEDIVAYLLRHVTACPGSTSPDFENELLSLRKLTAQYGNDPDVLSGVFQDRLQTVIQRYVDNGTVTVECSAEAIVNSTYTLNIKVMIVYSDGTMEPIVSHGKIYITNDRQYKIVFGD